MTLLSLCFLGERKRAGAWERKGEMAFATTLSPSSHSASAVTRALFLSPAKDWAGRKSSHSDPGLSDKVCFLRQLGRYCLDFHKHSRNAGCGPAEGTLPFLRSSAFSGCSAEAALGLWPRLLLLGQKPKVTGSQGKRDSGPCRLASPGQREMRPLADSPRVRS